MHTFAYQGMRGSKTGKVKSAYKVRRCMRTTIHLPDDRAEQIRTLAEAEGISQSEWLRRAIEAACVPSAYPLHTSAYPPETSTDELRAVQERVSKAEADLATTTAERDQAREDLAAERTARAVAEAEASAAATAREDLAAQVLELEEARHALEKRVIRAEVLAERMEAETTDAREASAKLTAEKDARIGELKQAYDHTVGLLADEKRRAEALIPERSGPSAGTVEAAAPITIQATAATVPPPLRKRMGMAWAIIRGVPA